MPENLLVTYPLNRINDLFVKTDSTLDFSLPGHTYKDSIIQGRPNVDHRFVADFYRKIAIDIVVETAMQYPYNFVTEKTYRPIINGRPFIILGPSKTLRFLKSLGFLTFSSIIDESYDEILDPEERFLKVCDVVLDFVKRPLPQVIQDVKGLKHILQHNRKNLARLSDIQLEDLKKQIKID